MLFYCDDNGSSFWQRQSPFYYFNFECSLKKRIIRCKAFLDFYAEYRNYRDLDKMLREKRVDFFKDNSVFDFVEDKEHSMKNLAIVYDAILTTKPELTQIWNNDSIAFKNSVEENGAGLYLFKNQKRLWSLKRYFGSNYKEVMLPKEWQQILRENYLTISFDFKNYK